MRDCGESDAREGQEPSGEIGSTQGGQPSDVPGGHPASVVFTTEDYKKVLQEFCGVPEELVGGNSTLAQEQVIQGMWTPPHDEGEFHDYEFDAQPYGRFSHKPNSEVEPDGREDRQSG